MSPGIGFGENGEGYVRFALVENKHRIRQAVRGIRRFLRDAGARRAAHGASGAVGVGLIGLGTIGTGVAKVLRAQRRVIAQRLGFPLRLVRIADLDARARSRRRPRGHPLRRRRRGPDRATPTSRS